MSVTDGQVARGSSSGPPSKEVPVYATPLDVEIATALGDLEFGDVVFVRTASAFYVVREDGPEEVR